MNGCAAPASPGAAHRTRPGVPLRRALPPQHIRGADVDKNLLNPEAITVESFDMGDSLNVYMNNGLDCTGCDSGCGIFPNDP